MEHTSTEEIQALAAGAQNGSARDLEALLRRLAPVAHAQARARLGDSTNAVEAATEALARVARGIGSLRDSRRVFSWLRRIVINCVADESRRLGAVAEAALTPRSDPAPGPLTAAISEERSREVRDAVSALPPRLGEIVLLHFIEDLTYREIADVIGVGIGTVSRRMDRARGLLRRALKEAS